MNNKFIINNEIDLDYDMINKILQAKPEVNHLEFNQIEIDMVVVRNIIIGTNINKLTFDSVVIDGDIDEIITVEELSFNNVVCNNFEILAKFQNINKLEILNVQLSFDCYYLRKLSNLKELKLDNVNLFHLGGLGYLNTLETLSIYNCQINNWVFITKIANLKTLYLNQDINRDDIPLIMLDVKIKKDY